MPSRSRSSRPSRPQQITPGAYVERNNLIIDASCYPPLNPPPEDNNPEAENNNPEKENDEHASHEVGGPEGSPKSQ